MADDEHDDDFPSDTVGNGTSAHCATCGTLLDAGAWHPTVGHTDPDGTYRIVQFCSDECRDEWRTTHEESDEA